MGSLTGVPEAFNVPAATTTTAPAPTEYVVMRLDGGTWREIARVPGRDSYAAVRAAVQKLDEDMLAGTYLAVPVRSWKPVKVTPQVETTLIIQDAP